MSEKKISDFFSSVDLSRACSVMVQVATIMRCRGVTSVLEIGPGRGNAGTLLKSFGLEYACVDTSPTYIEPTYVGDFLEFETTKKYDLVAAFQVFEHNPRTLLTQCLEKCASLASKNVVISLPYSGNHLSVSIRAKFFDQNRFVRGSFDLQQVVRFPVLFPQRRSRWRDTAGSRGSLRHQWEVGDRGCKVDEIVDEMSSVGLSCSEVFLNPYYPYHCFFVAGVRSSM
jgi:hypothetical protein